MTAQAEFRNSYDVASYDVASVLKRTVVQLASSAEARRDAVDRQQQRRSVLLAHAPFGSAVAAQQLDLLAIHLVEGGQAVAEALPEVREARHELRASGEPADHGRGAVVL